MPTIRNMNDMNKVLQPYIIKAMELTRDEIFEVVSRKVSDYYNEPVFSPPDEDIPDVYNRTGRLMESLTASHVTTSNGIYSFRVGWDDDYLTFHYPGGFTRRGHDKSYNKATGLQVLNWFNDSSHGGTVSGSHDYWDEVILELGSEQGIIDKFKRNCKKVGIPIM